MKRNPSSSPSSDKKTWHFSLNQLNWFTTSHTPTQLVEYGSEVTRLERDAVIIVPEKDRHNMRASGYPHLNFHSRFPPTLLRLFHHCEAVPAANLTPAQL